MIEVMKESEGALLGVHVSGLLHEADYRMFLPTLEERFREYGKLRVLFYADESFEGWDLRAAWEDVSVGLKHASDFERMAVVGAPEWVNWCMKLSAFLMKGEIRIFARDEIDDAWAWVKG
ncbi:SpoIIAA family protein [Stappia indica]|uniref:STAS/SEC14 domain-containing protein n=1 Tax=Stappia indica TaxID=538381 RepID=UPI001CD7B0CE|nr:STAS/SEC14 domain-containing protein [Stappia indica]MCA1298099.1 STAS/SEC14 domain-containing protein [Stappia indica]